MESRWVILFTLREIIQTKGKAYGTRKQFDGTRKADLVKIVHRLQLGLQRKPGPVACFSHACCKSVLMQPKAELLITSLRSNQKPAAGGGQLKKNKTNKKQTTLICFNRCLSPQYDYIIRVCGYLFQTAVNGHHMDVQYQR